MRLPDCLPANRLQTIGKDTRAPCLGHNARHVPNRSGNISSMSSLFVSSPLVKTLRHLALATLLLPVTLPASAGPTNSVLPAKVQQALKASKIENSALSLVMLPMSGGF